MEKRRKIRLKTSKILIATSKLKRNSIYDSKQARTISVREAARLHTFPDGFVFCGTMNPAFRQIGNAVPPLLAKAVAAQIMTTLKQAERETADEPARAAAAV